MAKRKKYLASEWLRLCSPEGLQATFLKTAWGWYSLNYNHHSDYDGKDYQGAAEMAESAECGDRAVGIKHSRLLPLV